MSYNPGSSLEDVVGSDPQILALWRSNRVTMDKTFIRFFEKYWGMSIEDEADEWRKSQITLGDTMDVDGSDISDCCHVLNILLNNRKVTRLGIEPMPSGKIPDALTTELSGLTGTIHYVLFMYLPLQLGILVI